MECNQCGGTEFRRDTRQVEYSYDGEHKIVCDVTGDFCNTCGEVKFSYGDAEWRRVSKLVLDFTRPFLKYPPRPFGPNPFPGAKLLGQSIMDIKQWRTDESNEGRPSGLDDFCRAHGL